MVIIKCAGQIPGEQFHRMANDLHAQARDGMVVLPFFCDLVAVSADSELQIIQEEKESTRVAALEKELAAALADLSAAPSCETCKNGDGPPAYGCLGAEGACSHCITKACPCRGCENGSGWEWRGACGDT